MSHTSSIHISGFSCWCNLPTPLFPSIVAREQKKRKPSAQHSGCITHSVLLRPLHTAQGQIILHVLVYPSPSSLLLLRETHEQEISGSTYSVPSPDIRIWGSWRCATWGVGMEFLQLNPKLLTRRNFEAIDGGIWKGCPCAIMQRLNADLFLREI